MRLDRGPLLLYCQQAQRTRASVPDAQAAVGGAGGQQRAVGRERQLGHLRAVAQQHLCRALPQGLVTACEVSRVASAAWGESASTGTISCLHALKLLAGKVRCAADATTLAPEYSQNAPAAQLSGKSSPPDRHGLALAHSKLAQQNSNCSTLPIKQCSNPHETMKAGCYLQRLPGRHVPELHGAGLRRDRRERAVRRQHAARGLRARTGHRVSAGRPCVP